MASPQPPYRDVTVGRLLTLLADALPGREALVYSHAGERWTFRALDDEARLIARGLIARGVKPGDRVAVWATNVPFVSPFALAVDPTIDDETPRVSKANGIFTWCVVWARQSAPW